MKLHVCLVFVLLFMMGCQDPSEEELNKGKNIDIERMTGRVVSMSVNYFKGDMSYTKEVQGQPYYCVTLAVTNSTGLETEESFVGVPMNVFDALSPGTQLPIAPLLTIKELAKIEGVVIDKQVNPDLNRFYIVIDDYESIKIYRVRSGIYYKRIDVGMSLPLQLDSEN